MSHLHLRCRHTLGILSLGVALVACQPASTASTSTPSTAVPSPARTSAAVATPAVADATVVPQPLAAIAESPSVTLPLDVAPSTVIAHTLPTLTPAEPAPAPPPASVRTADRLPADQPWLLVPDEQLLCGFSLIAVDHGGGWTRLDRAITAIGERAGSLPLLATCAADGTVAIVDPVQWTRVRIALDPGFFVTQFVVSPDRKQAMLYVISNQGNSTAQTLAAWIQITDLQTGAIRPFWAALPLGDGPFTDLLGWGHSGLYYEVRYRTVGATLGMFDPADWQASSRMLASDNLFVLDSMHDRMIRSNGSTRLILSDVHQGTRQVLEQAAWLSMPAFSPDGTALAYFRADDMTPPHVELVVFDIAHNTKTVLPHMPGTPFALMSDGFLMQAVMWSQDSQRIIIGTQSPEEAPQIALLTREGMLLNTVPLPVSEVLGYHEVSGITSDDQLVLDLHDNLNRHVVSWLPLRAGAAPYAPNVMADGYISSIILPALRAGAPPTAPTSAAPLPVTQLPAPAAPTQTPTPMASRSPSTRTSFCLSMASSCSATVGPWKGHRLRAAQPPAK